MFGVFNVVVSFMSCTVMMLYYIVCAGCLRSSCLFLMPLISSRRMFLSVTCCCLGGVDWIFNCVCESIALTCDQPQHHRLGQVVVIIHQLV